MNGFSPEVVQAVLRHMNGDHGDDSLVIVRAFADEGAENAEMIDIGNDGGVWRYRKEGDDHEVRLPWSTPITERPEIRREVVALHSAALKKLGLHPS